MLAIFSVECPLIMHTLYMHIVTYLIMHTHFTTFLFTFCLFINLQLLSMTYVYYLIHILPYFLSCSVLDYHLVFLHV